jgi:glycolate oxidase FAD binding subunit
VTTLQTLAKSCGEDRVTEATGADSVGDVCPGYVARPADATAVGAVMASSAQDGLAIAVRGRGTKLHWGHPPTELDVLVDLSSLNGVLEHAAGDLIVRVLPATPLADVQRAVAPAGQRLSIDEVVPGSTVGGIIATGLSGPSRLLHGAVRDLLIGVTVVRADGAFARSGGRVVKNVAGYDLCKLYTGSYGTLGVITEAIFRLHPVPKARTYVTAQYADELSAGGPVAAVLRSQLAPSALEIDCPLIGGPVTVCTLIEGSSPGVAARTKRVIQILGVSATVSEAPAASWAQLPGPTTVRLTTPIADALSVVRAVRGAAARLGVELAIRGSAGVGVFYAGLDSGLDPLMVKTLLDEMRTVVGLVGGFAVFLRGAHDGKSAVDIWGPVPGLPLMQRVKDAFDPEHRLAPGRFVGGI